MRRKVVVTVLILLAFLLQSTVFSKLTFADISPNLLVIITSSLGFMRGRKEGMWVGLLCGLLLDVFSGNILGFYALLFVLLGYLNGSVQHLFYDDESLLPYIMIALSDFLYTLTSFICLFLLRGKFIFTYFLTKIMIPELVYTLLVACVLYRVILYINRTLEAEEQRSASRFV